ncbi:MAG: AzlD domain-containing protein, partial [Peptococcaceae bacterium]|nr:AzlD domain-containing protein [Peptococcaceae bacterium]
MNTMQSVLFFAIITGGTMLARFLPFLLFPENREIPVYIRYLGRVLPYTIIGMLVVYCLRSTVVFRWP